MSTAKSDDVVSLASELMLSFLDSNIEIQQFARITAREVGRMRRGIALMEAVDLYQAQQQDEPQRAVAGAALAEFKKDVAFVEADGGSRMSAIWAQSIVSTWGTLESHVDDLLVALVGADKSFLSGDAVQKTKVSVAQFEAMTPAERVEYLVDALKRDLNARFKRGIMQFESVLELFFLSGWIDEPMKRAFIEFSAVRNLIVHRRSVIDRRFLDACPWIAAMPGTKLNASQRLSMKYTAYAALYAGVIQERVASRYEVRTDALDSLLARLKEHARDKDVPFSESTDPKPAD